VPSPSVAAPLPSQAPPMIKSFSAADLRRPVKRPQPLNAPGQVFVSPVDSRGESTRTPTSCGSPKDLADDTLSDTLWNKHVRDALKRRTPQAAAQVSPAAARLRAASRYNVDSSPSRVPAERCEELPPLCSPPPRPRCTSEPRPSPPLGRLPVIAGADTPERRPGPRQGEVSPWRLPSAAPSAVAGDPSPLRKDRANGRERAITGAAAAILRLPTPMRPARRVASPGPRIPASLPELSPVRRLRLQEPEPEVDRQRKCKVEAQARMSACYEDLISFLEMNGLSGAYALVLSANGIENLEQLLMLDDNGIQRLFRKCDFDAMDEILLLDSLRGARIPRA